MVYLVKCCRFSSRGDYVISFQRPSDELAVKSCQFILHKKCGAIYCNGTAYLEFNTISQSSIRYGSGIHCISLENQLNFHNFSSYLDCSAYNWITAMRFGIWNVNSINISKSSIENLELHAFFNCTQGSSIMFSNFESNNVSSITFYQDSSNVNASFCNLLKNNDTGNYKYPGLTYGNQYRFYINECIYKDNICIWMFFAVGGQIIVENTYLEGNNYTALNTASAIIKSTTNSFEFANLAFTTIFCRISYPDEKTILEFFFKQIVSVNLILHQVFILL